MKKIILIIAALTMLGLFSCNKEKECNCVATSGISGAATITTVTTQEACKDLDLVELNGNGDVAYKKICKKAKDKK